MNAMSRRAILRLAIVAPLAGGVSAAAASPDLQTPDPDLTREAILNDPQTPVGGDPQGDVTIVAFFDYNCLYCMKSHPELVKLLESDRRIRVVYKDWPIFGDISVYAAQVALAANLQGKYLCCSRRSSRDRQAKIEHGSGSRYCTQRRRRHDEARRGPRRPFG